MSDWSEPAVPDADPSGFDVDPAAFDVDPAAFLPEPDDAPVPDALIPPTAAEAAVVVPPVERPAPPDLGVLTRIEAEFAAVDVALAALDAGAYGTCAVCEAPIDPALLAADPVRRGCAHHPQATPTA